MKQIVYQCKACGAQQNNNLKTCEDCGGGQFLHRSIKTGKSRKPFLMATVLLLGFATIGGYFLMEGQKLFIDPQEQVKKQISLYYDVVHNARYHQFDEVFADHLDVWFGSRNISREEVVSKTKAYKESYVLQSSDIIWPSLTIATLPSGGHTAAYSLHYQTQKSSDSPRSDFKIQMDVEFNDDFKITALEEQILEKTATYYFTSSGQRTSNTRKADYYATIKLGRNNAVLEASEMRYMNGNLKFRGAITKVNSDIEPIGFAGTNTWYHQGGNRQKEEVYAAGRLVKRKQWTDKGQLSLTEIYTSGQLEKSLSNDYDYNGTLLAQTLKTKTTNGITTERFACGDGGCFQTRTESFLGNSLDGELAKTWDGFNQWLATTNGLTNQGDSDGKRCELITYSDIDQSDFRIAVDAVCPDAKKVMTGGIIFGYKNEDNQLQFLFDKNGYKLIEYRFGMKVVTLPQRPSTSIKPGKWNRLEVERSKGNLQLRINGMNVAVTQAPAFYGNGFGLVAPPSEEGLYGFKKFELHQQRPPITNL